MAGGKRIGFYLTESKFYFVESSDTNLLRVIVSAPFYTDEQNASEDVRLIALIQKTVREQNVNQIDVRLAIPQSDVIIRSFLIPVMKANELAPVVDFELRKHIPFDLKDFSYTFNTINVVENKVKKMRVLVAAVRQTLLEHQEQILNQAKLNVIVCEPASFSLVRVLFAKKIIGQSARFALVHIEGEVGRILFVHEGMVLFIREFQLQSIIPGESNDEQIYKARFINEIQNSLDFFNRAHENMPIAQIIILKQGIDKPFDQWLQEDITIPRKLIDVTALIGTHKEEDVSGVLYAFGAAVSDPRAANIFNLARKAIKKAAAVSIIPDIDYKEYMTAIKTAVVAIFLVGTMYFLFGMKISELQRTKDNLSTQQMDMADMPVEEIQKKIDDSKIKLKQYNGIVVKNEVADILIHLSKNIPDGVWLTSFSMQLITTSRLEKEQPILQSNWNVNFTAMIYDEDPNKEIRMVNEFMTTLKKDKGLAKYVKNISLVNMTQQEQKDKKVVVINVKGE